MFRDTQESKMQPDQFGVGSIIDGDSHGKFVLVRSGNSIRLLNLHNMSLSNSSFSVQDPNFISRDELAKICELTNLNWTTSDFDFNPIGIKHFNPAQ